MAYESQDSLAQRKHKAENKQKNKQGKNIEAPDKRLSGPNRPAE